MFLQQQCRITGTAFKCVYHTWGIYVRLNLAEKFNIDSMSHFDSLFALLENF